MRSAIQRAQGLAQTAASGAPTASGPASSSVTQDAAGAGEPSSGLSGRTALQVELTNGIDAKKAKPGDPVEAKLRQDVKSGDRVVLHRGAKLAELKYSCGHADFVAQCRKTLGLKLVEGPCWGKDPSTEYLKSVVHRTKPR